MYPWIWYVEVAELVCCNEIQDQMSWNGYLNEIIITLTDAEK